MTSSQVLADVKPPQQPHRILCTVVYVGVKSAECPFSILTVISAGTEGTHPPYNIVGQIVDQYIES